MPLLFVAQHRHWRPFVVRWFGIEWAIVCDCEWCGGECDSIADVFAVRALQRTPRIFFAVGFHQTIISVSSSNRLLATLWSWQIRGIRLRSKSLSYPVKQRVSHMKKATVVMQSSSLFSPSPNKRLHRFGERGVTSCILLPGSYDQQSRGAITRCICIRSPMRTDGDIPIQRGLGRAVGIVFSFYPATNCEGKGQVILKLRFMMMFC